MPHLKKIPNVKRVYLIGIGGTAMASLAGMLQQRGYEVAGSDEHVYPPMSTYLESLHIPVLEGYTREHLATFRPDLVVIGNVASRNNPEAEATLEMDLPYTSMPEAIYELFPNLRERLRAGGTTLSGGEQQMLAIGRILRTGARLLLLDEPTEGLAPVIVQQIGVTLRRLKREGFTVLLVEQNFRFAATVADRHYVMEHGRVVDMIPNAQLEANMDKLHDYLGV